MGHFDSWRLEMDRTVMVTRVSELHLIGRDALIHLQYSGTEYVDQ
jgi:hypothetical protein